MILLAANDINARIFGAVFAIVVTIIIIIIKSILDKQKQNREKQIISYADRKGLKYIPFYTEPLKNKDKFNCFLTKLKPSYNDVVIKSENGERIKLCIGELRWLPPTINSELIAKYQAEYCDISRMEANILSFVNYTTMCVLYENGFHLPNFDLARETLIDKTSEMLKLKVSEDIDFDDDKEFSNAWWLSSSENMIARELFDKSTRSFFMKYVNKGYSISGNRDMLIIITDKLYTTNKYVQLEADMRNISKFLKTKEKFYKKEADYL